MEMTRRKWMLAAATAPLQMKAVMAAAAEGPAGAGARGNMAPPVTLGAAPSLPDKASFPDIKGTFVNSAGSHPRSAGSTALIKKAFAAELGEPDGFRPNQNRLRGYFAKLINADADEVTFVPSTHTGEALVAAALGLPAKGVHVVSDDLHFVGSQAMYLDMQKRGIEVTWVKVKDGRIPLEDMDKAIIKGKTRLVAVSSTSMINGYSHDLKKLCEIAHAKGALVHADAIQTAGNVPLDVKDCGIDSLCAGTYKWLMSSGAAFLYVSKAAQAKMQPPVYHFTRDQVPGQAGPLLPTTHMYPFDAPGKEILEGFEAKPGIDGLFELGYQPNTATLAGLEYSLPYIMNIGVAKIQAHAKTLTDVLKAELPKRGYPLFTPVENPSPIVTVAVKDATKLGPTIAAQNVQLTTRWNHIRVAVSVFNDMGDVERVLAAMPKAV